MRLLIRLNAMSALWRQCQQGSSNEGWAKSIQAAALALGFSSEPRFTTSLADAPQHDMSQIRVRAGRKKAVQRGRHNVSFCTPSGFVEIQAPTLERMAGTTGLEPAASAVTVNGFITT